MTKAKQPNKKVIELIKQLNTPQTKDLINTIKSLKVNGDETALEPLVKLYTQTQNNAIKSEIADLFNTLKSSKAPQEVIKCLTNPKYESARQMLLSSIWNSNLDYTNYLTEIVDQATKGDMMDAMECLTILENMEGTLDEQKIMDPLIQLKSYLVENQNDNSQKTLLLKEVAHLLSDINDNL
jgi:uncharacterized membrane protein YheB (UPF0754 family)